jgi:hypothetical protein
MPKVPLETLIRGATEPFRRDPPFSIEATEPWLPDTLIVSPTQSISTNAPQSLSAQGRNLAFRMAEILHPRRLDLDRRALSDLLESANALAQTLRDPDSSELEVARAREFDTYFGLVRKLPGPDALVVGSVQAICELVLVLDSSSQPDHSDILNGFGLTLSLLAPRGDRRHGS